MKFKIQLFSEASCNESTVTEISTLDRACTVVEDVGLTLAEAKALLAELQTHIVQAQVTEYHEPQRPCSHCGQLRPLKGYHPRRFRTPFGDVHIQSPRWHHCGCDNSDTKTYSPLNELLTTHTAPELLYLESKWASLIPYGATVRMLQDVLPIGEHLNRVTVRNHLHSIAERMEAELGPEQFMFVDGYQNEWEAYPEPDGPITVGIDGGNVRGRERKPGGHGNFEVIAGKSITAEGDAKCFALVNTYDQKPKRRLYELLKSQGMQPRQQVTFLSDGGDTVRKLQEYLNPESEHLLDWFHITMRITVMVQLARGLPKQSIDEILQLIEVLLALDRFKWYLWHGNVIYALRTADSLIDRLMIDEFEEGKPHHKNAEKHSKALEELITYFMDNAASIPNYGERYRFGERISTGFVESTVNQVVSKRFVKKQQIQWTRRGAHLLLQVRTNVLNDELDSTFQKWFPKFRQIIPEEQKLAA